MGRSARRKWQPTPVLLPGKFHGQRGLEDYSPRPAKVRHSGAPRAPAHTLPTHTPPFRGNFFKLISESVVLHIPFWSAPVHQALQLPASCLREVSWIPQWSDLCHPDHSQVHNQGALTRLWMVVTESGFHGCPSQRRRSSVFSVPGLSLEMHVLTGGDRELKGVGTLFSVPIISKRQADGAEK